MITWTQAYTPLGNLVLSALVAALPVCVLLGLLAFSHIKAHVAALAALAASIVVAVAVYRMPWQLSGMAALDGIAYGLFPIGWIVLAAIFIYDITVHTGQFEIIKQSVAGLADDRRIQAILIAFCFGSFIEGAAGFGTPVAISAAMLIGLGFRPLSAAGLALIGNTAPVAFGALGTPILALAKVTAISPEVLGAMIGRQLTLFGLLIPFWLVCAMAGWRRMLEVWPACLTAGLSFAATQLIVSNLHGPWLVDIAASLASILSLLVLLRFWQPKSVWRFDHEEDNDADFVELAPRTVVSEPGEWARAAGPTRIGHVQFPAQVPTDPNSGPADEVVASGDPGTTHQSVHNHASPRLLASPPRPTTRQTVIAWMPWVIVSLLVFLWGIPPVKVFLNDIRVMHRPVSQFALPVPLLDKAVFRAPPVVRTAKAEEAVFTFNWLSATGTALLISGIVSGLLLGVRPVPLLRLFAKTLHRVRSSLLCISAMMAIGFTTRYAGLDATMGLAFASTGKLFPLFSPMLGWLGVALTGSDTASNVLFGNLQQVTANTLGFSPVLAASANSSGGVMGKMIDAQSIVVAGVATGQRGGEGQILRYVFFHSIALALLVGLEVMFQAYVLGPRAGVVRP